MTTWANTSKTASTWANTSKTLADTSFALMIDATYKLLIGDNGFYLKIEASTGLTPWTNINKS